MESLLLCIGLVIGAFLLGACPFAVWIGKYLVKTDIRKYGDGNPGTINVFRAGSIKWGILALFFEIGKGFPFVFVAYNFFKLPIVAVMVIVISAVLGHAFSPILKFKGGKALAVTGGTLLALPPYHIFIVLIIFIFLFFLFVDQDSWTVILGFASGCIALTILKGISWEPILVAMILTIIAFKHFNDLKKMPKFELKLLRWLHTRKAVH